MEIISQHNHTDFVAHGHAPIPEVIAAAKQRGMTNLAFTEHYHLTDSIDPDHYVGLPLDRIAEYQQAVLEQRDLNPELEILLGTELDWLGDDEDRTFAPNEFDAYDIILGSVHYLDKWGLNETPKRALWDSVDVDDVYHRYFEQWCRACLSDFPYTVMSHPDVLKKFGHRPSFDLTSTYQDAALAAREGDRMIEVNSSGLYYDVHELFPAQPFLREFCRAGVPCTVGSDAHEPKHVDRGILQAYRAMYEAGYRVITCVMPGGDRREIPLS